MVLDTAWKPPLPLLCCERCEHASGPSGPMTSHQFAVTSWTWPETQSQLAMRRSVGCFVFVLLSVRVSVSVCCFSLTWAEFAQTEKLQDGKAWKHVPWVRVCARGFWLCFCCAVFFFVLIFCCWALPPLRTARCSALSRAAFNCFS